MNRDQAIDQSKGILIILVVLFHITYTGSLSVEFNEAKRIVYYFHMPAFLIITGYFLQTTFLSDFIRKIAIPHYLFYLIYLIILLITNKYSVLTTSNRIENFSALVDAFLFNPIGSYWYLHSVILFFISIYLSDKLSSHFSAQLKFTIKIAIAMLLIYTFKKLNFEMYWWVFLSLLLGHGLKVGRYTLSGPFFFLAAAVLISIILNINELEFFNIAIGYAVLQALLFLGKLIKFGPICFIGRNSLLILLLHTFPVNMFKPVAPIFLHFNENGLIYIFVTLSFTIVFCIYSGFLVERLNLGELIFSKKNVVI